jgi:hypothetical protein
MQVGPPVGANNLSGRAGRLGLQILRNNILHSNILGKIL